MRKTETYTIARTCIFFDYDPKDWIKHKILLFRDFCTMTTIFWYFIAPEQCCCVGRGQVACPLGRAACPRTRPGKGVVRVGKKVDKGTASRSLYCIGSNELLAYQQGERVRELCLDRVVERLSSPLPSGCTMSRPQLGPPYPIPSDFRPGIGRISF